MKYIIVKNYSDRIMANTFCTSLYVCSPGLVDSLLPDASKGILVESPGLVW